MEESRKIYGWLARDRNAAVGCSSIWTGTRGGENYCGNLLWQSSLTLLPPQDVVRLRELAQTNAAIRTFWVGSITNGTPFAFSVLSERSVFMSRQADGKDLAHEVGHVLELEDLYDVLKHYSPGRDMVQVNEEVRKAVFGDQVRDWGLETGRGFYPADFSIRDVFETLLMYGYKGELSLDIPSGTVHGLFEWSRNVLERKDVKVGAGDININMED